MLILLILLEDLLLLIGDDIVDAEFHFLFGRHGNVDFSYLFILTYRLTPFNSAY